MIYICKRTLSERKIQTITETLGALLKGLSVVFCQLPRLYLLKMT